MGGVTTTVTPGQRSALQRLGPALPGDAYLAGGVAVALTFEHRVSRDLDFFVPNEFDPERLAEHLQGTLAGASLVVTNTATSTLYLEVDGVPASIITYGYPLLSPPRPTPELGTRVASLEDLAAMKLSAIAARGAARDFWDLHTILAGGTAGGTLSGALELYRRKFTTHDIGHVVRSLAYFGDADSAPLPRGLDPAHWSTIKAWFSRAVAEIG
jgi:hypothetical protein